MYGTKIENQDMLREMTWLKSDRHVCQNLFKIHEQYSGTYLHAQETYSRPTTVLFSREQKKTASVTGAKGALAVKF